MSKKKSSKKARHASKDADWQWQSRWRVLKALEAKVYAKPPESLLDPCYNGASCGHTLAYLAHLRDGQSIPREVVAFVNKLFEKPEPRPPQPSPPKGGILPSSPFALVGLPEPAHDLDLENEMHQQALVKVLLGDVWKMSYDDLRKFFRGVADAIESTPPNLTQATLINFVYAQHGAEIADMVARREKIAAITDYINTHLPGNLRVSAASVKKVIQRHDLPRRRLSQTLKRKRGHA